MANTNNQNSFLDYAGLALFWNNVKNIIKDNELVTATALTDLDTRVDTLEETTVVQIISKTYSELKTLRDNSQLVPGQQYRITDYTCTTTQENTKSAGHVFDIIVTADDASTLNEVARAVKHKGDTYFANSDLNAWKVWYCLDNDTNRFAWADSANGKGIIYRMIDEWNNDVPYDFKNIMFKRYILDANNAIATDVAKEGELNAVKTRLGEMSHRIHTSLWYYGEYVTDVCPNAEKGRKYVPFGDILYDNDGPGVLCPINEANSNWFYTFSDTSFNDNTVTGQSNVHNNVVKGNKYALVTIDGEGRYSFEEQENICLNDIIFIGNICYYNSFGNHCYSNSFGNDCYYNSFGNDCYYNSFGNGCNSNSFGNYCYYNSFGNNCIYNSFGNNCNYNSFGNDCYSNSFRNSCYSNSFGNICRSNSFGNECHYNTFGNYCHYNSFGNNCYYIKFASDKSATTKYNYYHENHFENGCKYIIFTGIETASSSAWVQNYNFAQGVQGTSSAYLTIDGVRNRDYETYISKDTDGTIKESVIAEKLDKVIEISYNDLVTLRGSSKLVPGQQYRITDYTCTTTQENTKSAGHVFDIIVTADDASTLNEVARAVKHKGDTYFANSDLNAWKVWYCLDNDTNRFAWADATNGKGVIYRMIDEFNNDIPYDFKNIQFKRYKITSSVQGDLGGKYATPDVVDVTVDNSTPYWCYTFSTDSLEDVSLDGYSQFVYNNIIPEYHYGLSILNNIVFIGTNNMGNTFGILCFDSTFGNNCYGNTFGNNCCSNTLGDVCYGNIFGNSCSDNIFGNNCQVNTFGNECSNNTFGDVSQNNTFGNKFIHITFGDSCSYNTFGNNCQYNTFGDNCDNNTFGNDCSSIIFGNYCSYNTFGNYCTNNSFGNSCSSNSFGNDCRYNSFRAIGDITGSKISNCRYNAFDDGCSYNIIYSSNTSGSAYLENYHINRGVKGTSNKYMLIDAQYLNSENVCNVYRKGDIAIVSYIQY